MWPLRNDHIKGYKMAKQISLVGSNIKNVAIERDGDIVTITVVGSGVDGDGNPYVAKNMVMNWVDMSVQDQMTGNNFLKFLSKSFNNHVAEENSETWVNP